MRAIYCCRDRRKIFHAELTLTITCSGHKLAVRRQVDHQDSSWVSFEIFQQPGMSKFSLGFPWRAFLTLRAGAVLGRSFPYLFFRRRS